MTHWISVLLLMLCVPACEPLVQKAVTVSKPPIPNRSMASVVAPIIIQDKSGIKVISASLPVSNKELLYSIVRTKVTSYCPCRKCCGRLTGKTANGGNAWKPGVACDWTWLPAGTKVYVPGYGLTTVDDKGGLLKRKYWENGVPRMDLRVKYHWQAKQFGIQYLDVKVFH